MHKAVGKAGYAGQFVSTQGCPEGRCKCVSTCVCVCAPLATRHLWLWLQELGLVRQQAWREREGWREGVWEGEGEAGTGVGVWW